MRLCLDLRALSQSSLSAWSSGPLAVSSGGGGGVVGPKGGGAVLPPPIETSTLTLADWRWPRLSITSTEYVVELPGLTSASSSACVVGGLLRPPTLEE